MRRRHESGATAGAVHSPLATSTSAPSHHPHRQLSVRQRPATLVDMYCGYPFLLASLYLRVMDAVPAFVRRLAEHELPAEWRIMLARLKTNHIAAFDGAAAGDARTLQRLWAAHCRITFKGERPFSPVDPVWKEMGFQDTNPAKDFRGGGRLSLEQLVYLAENHPEDWHCMLGSGDFLLASAGINVSLRLMALLGIGEGVIAGPTTRTLARTCFSTAQAKRQACAFLFETDIHSVFVNLNEMYCAVMRLLFMRWMESPQSIMEFNSLLAAVYVEAERLMYACESLEEFCRLLAGWRA